MSCWKSLASNAGLVNRVTSTKRAWKVMHWSSKTERGAISCPNKRFPLSCLQDAIYSLLAVRRRNGIHAQSSVRIRVCHPDLYVAQVGTFTGPDKTFRGVYVKLGPSMELRGGGPPGEGRRTLRVLRAADARGCISLFEGERGLPLTSPRL